MEQVHIWHGFINLDGADVYKHLHWTNYYDYFDDARIEFNKCFFNADDFKLSESGVGLWISKSSIRYIRPALPGQEIFIRSYFTNPIRRCRIQSQHKMADDNGSVLAVSEISQFFSDLRTGKPIKISDKRVEHLVGRYVSGRQLS